MVIKKFLRNLNDYGLLPALKKGFFYIIGPLYKNRTYRVYGMDLEKYQIKDVDDGVFSFRFIETGDTDMIGQIEQMEEWLKGKIVPHLENHCLCMVALDGEKVAGFNLISLKRGCLPLIEFTKELREHQAWSEQITVHRDYRGKGLATKLRYKVFAELIKRGVKKVYGGAQISNTASLKLARKVGLKDIVDIQYIKVLNVKKYNYKRVTD